ncbi:MAG: DinB family protein [Bryobacterales bacterium]|nr:DinB family protein [Bryobacterales bacterium]
MHWLLVTLLLLAAMPASLSGQPPEGLGRGWSGEFEHAARQLVSLAEATPADKFAFRPAPGVRSTSEVYMHVAAGSYWLLAQAGVKPGGAHWPKEIPPDIEKKVTGKAEVVRWLKDSLAAVRASHSTVNGARTVKFVGAEVPAAHVLLRLLVHNHEHMGQAVAYARMSGVTPPWSREP